MGPRRVLKGQKPSSTEDPGPVGPVSPTNRTNQSAYYQIYDPDNPSKDLSEIADASLYYNEAISAGEVPERAAFKPTLGGEGIPDVIIRMDNASLEKKDIGLSGKDLNDALDFFRGQINILYQNQMDALANQNKETLGHANTRDAFAITYTQLHTEVEKKVKLQEENDRLAAQVESNLAGIQGETKAVVDTLKDQLEEQAKLAEERRQEIAALTEELHLVADLTVASGSNTDPEELKERLQAERTAAASKDTLIENLRGQLEDQKKLVLNNQASFAEVFRTGDHRQQLQTQLATERQRAAERDGEIDKLKAELAKAKQLVITNQTSFSGVLRAGDHRQQLETQLVAERRRVAERDATINELTGELEKATQGKTGTQNATEREKAAKQEARIRSLEAQLKEIEDSKTQEGEGLHATYEMVNNLLKEHRAGRSEAGIGSRSETLIQKHNEWMEKTTTVTFPAAVRTRRAVGLIISAQLAIGRNQVSEALDFLNEAEQENSHSPLPDRRIEGRIAYWKGRANLKAQDPVSAVPYLERAYKIERRGSSQGTLYATTTTKTKSGLGDEDDNGRLNSLVRGQDLKVSFWLDRARRLKEEFEGDGPGRWGA